MSLITLSPALQATSEEIYPPFQFVEEQIRMGGTIEGVFYQAPYAFVSRTDATIIYNVSVVETPVQEATVPQFVAKAKVESYLYGENWDTNKWEVWDVNNPTIPTRAATFEPGGDLINATNDYLFFLHAEGEEAALVAYSLSDPLLPTFVGRWVLGPASDSDSTVINWSVFYDNHLFVGFFTTFCSIQGCNTTIHPVAILDVTNPSEPIRFVENSMRLSGREAYGVQGQYLFQLEESYTPSQLYVYELDAGPGTIALAHTYALNDFNPERITLNGSILYLANADATKILDISNPIAPFEIGTVQEVIAGFAYEDILFRIPWYSRYGFQPYVSKYSPYLTIFDLQNPVEPLSVSTVYHTYGEEVIKNSDFLYVIDQSEHPSYPFTLHTIDGRLAEMPTLIRTDPFPNSEILREAEGFQATVVKNDYLYLHLLGIGVEENLMIYRLPTDDTDLALVRTLNFPIYSGFSVSGNSLLTAGENGKDVYDITDPTNPVLASSLPLQPFGSTVVEGEHAYIGHTSTPTESAIYVVNVADPYAPVIVGNLDAMVYLDGAVAMDVENGFLYYLQSDGIHITDVGNPATPQEVGMFPPVFNGDIYVHQERLYLITRHGLGIDVATYQVEEPESPQLWSRRTTILNCMSDFPLTDSTQLYGLEGCTGGVRTFGFVDGITQFLPLLYRSPS